MIFRHLKKEKYFVTIQQRRAKERVVGRSPDHPTQSTEGLKSAEETFGRWCGRVRRPAHNYDFYAEELRQTF